ncbi:MAG: hypothetical protein EZS28_054035, partial [Streblomastix strix]
MNQAQALKNLMENGTSIEYFNDGYIMKAKDKIKVYEEEKKSAKTLTQAQQTKLLLQARGGGQTKPKRATKRQIESDFDEEEQRGVQTDRPRRREYNIHKYKEVPRETAQVEPEQVVKDT